MGHLFFTTVSVFAFFSCANVADSPYEKVQSRFAAATIDPGIGLSFSLDERHFNILGIPLYNRIDLIVTITSPLSYSDVVLELTRNASPVVRTTVTLPPGTTKLKLYPIKDSGMNEFSLELETSAWSVRSTYNLYVTEHLTRAIERDLVIRSELGTALPIKELAGNIALKDDLTLEPGEYMIANENIEAAFIVRKAGIVLDCAGSKIVGPGRSIGIKNDGFDSIVVKNCSFEQFYYGLSFADSSGHLIADNDFSTNYMRPSDDSANDFLNILNCPPPEEDAGGGMVFNRVSDSTVLRNVATKQQNGLGLHYSANNVVEENDFSDNHGWGIFMCHSSGNDLIANRADNNYNKVSRYCHEVQQDGCDSAAIVMMKGASDNNVLFNSIQNSGDGIFLAGLPQFGPGGADNNYFLGNDASYTKHLCFEATFSTGNHFEKNIAAHAGRVGFWLGYSDHSKIIDNYIADNGWDGINIDHGEYIDIKDNYIANNRQNAIEIWRSEFLDDQYAPANHYTISNNRIIGSSGITVTDMTFSTVSGNCIEPRPALSQNGIVDIQVDNQGGPCQRSTVDEWYDKIADAKENY